MKKIYYSFLFLTIGMSIGLCATAADIDACMQKLKTRSSIFEIVTEVQLRAICGSSDPGQAIEEEFGIWGSYGVDRAKREFFSAMTPDPVVSCYAREALSDGGYSVTLTKNGNQFDYKFELNSISGPHSIATNKVILGTASSGSHCRIVVSSPQNNKDGTGSNMFFFERRGSNGDFDLKPIPGSTVPDLVCKVDADLSEKMCGKVNKIPTAWQHSCLDSCGQPTVTPEETAVTAL